MPPLGYITAAADREDSERNVFVLDLASRLITQVTREPWADRPTWSPHGQAIVYMSLLGEPRELRPSPSAVLRRAQLDGGKTETIIAERRPFTSVFHLADGRLAWSVIESPQPGFSRGTSRVEALSDAGVVSAVGTFDTYADRVIASHSGEGLYCRCYPWPDVSDRFSDQTPHQLLFLPLITGVVRQTASLARWAWLPTVWSERQPFRFALTSDSSILYVGDTGRVWKIVLSDGRREPVSFTARVKLEIQDPVIPRKPDLPAAGSSVQRPTPPPVLVRRVRVLDYTARGFRQESSLYIEQGRIRWIGAERGRNIPRGAVIVDAGGRYAIPGLFDMHVHTGVTGAEQAAFVAYGVTSVRDVGSPLARPIVLSDRRGSNVEVRPRFFVAGDMLQGGRGYAVKLRDESEARSYVQRWKESGVHFIKVHPPISWRLQRAVADEARLQGLPIVAHGITVEELTKGVMLGYASLEHVSYRPYDDVLQMLVAAGTYWDPTLEAPVGKELLLRGEPERLADPRLQAFIPARIRESREVLGLASTTVLRAFWLEMLAGIQPAYRRGVKLLAGTDASWGGPMPFFGVSLHWELEHLVEAGLPALEVLRIATQHAAEALAVQDDLGTLEVGKVADIVLLDKNCLDDIKNTQSIWRVIKDGWLFDPDELRPPRLATPK